MQPVFFSASAKTDPTIVFHPHGSEHSLFLTNERREDEVFIFLDRVRMCELMTGEEINILSGHFDVVNSVIAHPLNNASSSIYIATSFPLPLNC